MLLCVQGKNKPTRRHKKKQTNIIEEKKPEVLKRMREEVSERREDGRRHACLGAPSRESKGELFLTSAAVGDVAVVCLQEQRKREKENRVKEQRKALGEEAPRALARFYK